MLRSRGTHQPLDLLIMNLAVADLLNCITVSTFHVMEILIPTYARSYAHIPKVYQDLICKLWITFVCTKTSSSCQILAFIRIERWKAICFPFSKPFHTKKIRLLIIGIWLTSFCVAILLASGH